MDLDPIDLDLDPIDLTRVLNNLFTVGWVQTGRKIALDRLLPYFVVKDLIMAVFFFSDLVLNGRVMEKNGNISLEMGLIYVP